MTEQNVIREAASRLSVCFSVCFSDILLHRQWWNSYGNVVAHTVWPESSWPPYTILKPAYYTLFGDVYPWDCP